MAIPIGVDWLLAVVVTNSVGVDIQVRIKCGKAIVPILVGMYIYLVGIFL